MVESSHPGPFRPDGGADVTLAATPDPNAPSGRSIVIDANSTTIDAGYEDRESGAHRRGESGTLDADLADFDSTRGARRYDEGPLLGAGGMGEVRLHVDRRIGRRIARKTLHTSADTELARRRFVREVRVQGQLEHPAVVPVYDLDVDDQGRVYFTMKRVRGETLERVLERLREGDPAYVRRFGLRRLLAAFAQVCFAIDYAHTRDVVHRDLKPGNVMLGDFGEVYVLDWGLAKITGEPDLIASDDAPPASERASVVGASDALTAGNVVLGTPGYMAPEQLPVYKAAVDARTDVYALGAILFEILTRTRFRTSSDLRSLLSSVSSGEVVRPSNRVPDVPPELDDLCARAVAIQPRDRPGSARELAEAVERYLDGDHDLELRRDLAARHAAAARRRVEGSTDGGARPGGEARVEALRETMKALALDADNVGAQRLLVELLTEVSDEVPKEAEPDLAAVADRLRARGAKLGGQGLLMWLALLVPTILIGVLSWPVIGATAASTLAAALYCRHLHRRGGYGTRETLILAVLVATTVALTSCYLGPFTLVPTCAATAALLFATAATRRERPWLAAILAIGAATPFVAEITGIVPRAYTFEPGRIVVFARAIALPEGATMATMLYISLSFPILALILVGGMRDALSASERRQFLQAWYLRQLFPSGEPQATRQRLEASR